MSKILRSRAAFLSLGLSAAFLAGCASNTRVEPPAPVESRGTGTISGAGTGAAQGAGTGGTGGVGSSAVTPVDTGRNADAAAGAGRVVYFDFDSFVVKDEYRSVVEAHARRMSADRKRRMIVEGHTDERGGREYNLALGQKRADAVVRSMVLLGALEAATQLDDGLAGLLVIEQPGLGADGPGRGQRQQQRRRSPCSADRQGAARHLSGPSARRGGSWPRRPRRCPGRPGAPCRS